MTRRPAHYATLDGRIATAIARGLALLLILAGVPTMDLDAHLLRASDVDALPSKPATVRAAYGTDPLQFGDLRLPLGDGPFPVAIVIHGGCWVERYASIVNSTPLADALRDAGVATWNIEYRRTDSPSGGWPNTFLDVLAATAHLRVLARTHPLDLDRVVTVGHSAGGHLALWLAAAAEGRVPASSPIGAWTRDRAPVAIRAAVALAGIADLADFRTYSANTCGDVVDPFMGGTPEAVPERYAAGSPVQLLPMRTPQVQVVGEFDRVMPARAREAHAAAVRASGSPVELVVVPGAGHHELMSPRSVAWATVRRTLLRQLGSEAP